MDKRIHINFLGIKITIKNCFVTQNNKVVLNKCGKIKTLHFVKGLKVKFYGTNNTVEFIDKVPKMKNVKIDCGQNTNIKIAKSNYRIKNLYINARAENVGISISEDFSIESGKFDFHGEPNCNIRIGKDCQFGCNISIDTADGHTIYDNETRNVINTPKDINISNHVWLCENVSVLKGSFIANDVIVAKNALVSGKMLEPNAVIAGLPAKIVKSNVNWSRAAIKEFMH